MTPTRTQLSEKAREKQHERISATFAGNLLYLRKRYGMSQADFAEAIGLRRSAQSMVSMWESDAKRIPDVPHLARIANRFGLSMDQLVNEDLFSKNMIVEEREVSL